MPQKAFDKEIRGKKSYKRVKQNDKGARPKAMWWKERKTVGQPW